MPGDLRDTPDDGHPPPIEGVMSFLLLRCYQNLPVEIVVELCAQIYWGVDAEAQARIDALRGRWVRSGVPRLVAAGVSAAWGLSPCRSRDEVEALLAGVEQAFPNLAEDCQRLRHLHGG